MSHILRRFYLPPKKIKKNAFLEGDEKHHLEHVLRLTVGDKIEITDGKGGIYCAEITKINKKRVSLQIKEKIITTPPSLKIYLAISLLKMKSMDLVIQKATELGAWAVYVCTTEHSVSSFENKEKKLSRWQKIAIEALKQSGNNYLPKINTLSFNEIIRQTKDLKLMAIGPREEGKTIPLLSALFQNYQITEILIFIGPEGGFSKKEIEEAIKNKFILTNLNPYILRSETAVITALGIIQNWSTWRNSNLQP